MLDLRKLPQLFILVAAGLFTRHFAVGFSPQRSQPILRVQTNNIAAKKYHAFFPLAAGLDGNNDQVDNSEVEDSFDGKGFAGYLAPYAAALILSIGVTGAFVKFVLLDY